MTTALTRTLTSQALLAACAADPDRWASATAVDEDATALCRACPRRWECAREGCTLPGVQGIWAGVFVPAEGRTRTFALRQLRSLAEHGTRQLAR
jgi:WhiB family transcriptional regulator, redox-sensing transcriptional regulator